MCRLKLHIIEFRFRGLRSRLYNDLLFPLSPQGGKQKKVLGNIAWIYGRGTL